MSGGVFWWCTLCVVRCVVCLVCVCVCVCVCMCVFMHVQQKHSENDAVPKNIHTDGPLFARLYPYGHTKVCCVLCVVLLCCVLCCCVVCCVCCVRVLCLCVVFVCVYVVVVE